MGKKNRRNRQNSASTQSQKPVTRTNSLPDVNGLDAVFGMASSVSPLSMPYQLSGDNSYAPVTLNRVLLSYAYMTHGVIQTMIDQPVEDAFRGGVKIICDELDDEDKKTLHGLMEELGDFTAIKHAMKWAKLYGGAGVLANTDQSPESPLDINKIGSRTPLAFIAADRWELILQAYHLEDRPYNYYGQSVDKSRVCKVMGKEAPSFIRKRLQGWGMSELERTLRQVQMYTKNEDTIFELLDEAKIDVWKIQNFNSQMLSSLAAGQTNKRLQIATMTKNYHNAITLDKEDDYEQKQISFSGLAEMMKEIRVGVAASVRIPMTKLYGISAAGFSSGEDDIENYNALVESEVRAKAKEVLRFVVPLRCKQVFGFVPEVLDFEFKPLRVLGADQEENVKRAKFDRSIALYDKGMLSPKELMENLKTENIFTDQTEVGDGLREPEPPTNGEMDALRQGDADVSDKEDKAAETDTSKD